MSGDIGDVYEQWRSEVVRCLAYTEAMIDFGDDEDDVTDESYGLAIQRYAYTALHSVPMQILSLDPISSGL